AFSPCFTTASKAMLPLASTVRARIFDPPFSSRRPMPSGYCATWISGKAPPSPKSSGRRGTNPPLFPYGGTGLAGPAGFSAAAAEALGPPVRTHPSSRTAARAWRGPRASPPPPRKPSGRRG
uniref:Uncharacterized protein n=1 Tax=Oryza brachyantha TaxID=4533 RepID=J3LHA9_ORYBR